MEHYIKWRGSSLLNNNIYNTELYEKIMHFSVPHTYHTTGNHTSNNINQKTFT